jgi:hypothetical protein
MVITYKTSNNIEFPAYLLPSYNWTLSDNILSMDNQILDDRNMSGDTLGKRRLQTPFKSIFPLKVSVVDLVGILKQKKNYFIDSLGKVFIYEKTKFVPLKYYKIERIQKKEHSSSLFIKNCNIPFVIPRPPADNLKYVGILHIEKLPWLLYDYSETCLKDTKRKI